MRLDLGVLQMELAGRPDGLRPHGHESLLDYFQWELAEHKRRNGTEASFYLTGDQCQSLREEAVMYYHRYLSLFVLEDFHGVVRDTTRNLRVLELCGKYARDEHDRLILEQHRPYITMMNTRATASILFQQRRYAEAMQKVNEGLEKIRRVFAQFEQEDLFLRCNEAKVLRKFARDIRKKMPADPMRRLQNKLERAIREEHYEEAARLRDEIQRKNKAPD
jgi:hypothetical protein